MRSERRALLIAAFGLLAASAAGCGVGTGYAGRGNAYFYSVFVADAGSGNLVNYQLQTTTGALTLQGTLNGASTGLAGSSPISLAMSPSGAFLYMLTRGNGTNGAGGVSVFKIDPSTGTPSYLSSAGFTGLSNPRGLAIDPHGNWLYTANYGDSKLARLNLDPSSGAVSGLVETAVSGSPDDVSLNASGSLLAVARFVDNKISVYPMASDGTLGTATQIFSGNPGNPGQSTQPTSVRFSSAGQIAVANPTASATSLFSLNGANAPVFVAMATGAQPYDTPSSIAWDPSGAFVYALTQGGTIQVYAASGSALTAKASYSLDTGQSIWIDGVSGDFALVTESGGVNAVNAFRRDAASGSLTLTDTESAGNQPIAVTATRISLGI